MSVRCGVHGVCSRLLPPNRLTACNFLPAWTYLALHCADGQPKHPDSSLHSAHQVSNLPRQSIMQSGGFGQGLLLTDFASVTPRPLPQSSVTLLCSAPLLPGCIRVFFSRSPGSLQPLSFVTTTLHLARLLSRGSSNAVGLL